MQLITCKGLIRFILLLISIQLFSSSVTPGLSSESFTRKHYTFQAQHEKLFSLSFFFEGTKTEKEDEGKEKKNYLCFEIADLSHAPFILTKIHTPCLSINPIEQLYDLQPPLFKLHRVYVI